MGDVLRISTGSHLAYVRWSNVCHSVLRETLLRHAFHLIYSLLVAARFLRFAMRHQLRVEWAALFLPWLFFVQENGQGARPGCAPPT